MKNFKSNLIIAFFLTLLLLPAPTVAQDFPDVCQQAENVMPNCTFDAGLDRWQTFTESGSANFAVLQGGENAMRRYARPPTLLRKITLWEACTNR
jgi:hypothetical protein